ncbi:MAG: PEP/pyruvate-binding domain-containing protein [Candidatus Eisenbacteria bacterium]|uniref:PEP/pyruvate-binding domain-containing protein n=1 Tax=Eiseniibacteriota bacterium TaxID=2212470 RepID=A0A948RWA1_UNCEI|nr:PEP/pyruvate-binding domain-containing protein [Candidatus Eisenbacteria bacterium]MBU1948721.1 PEP/pyruvate-binding domain-containing protein [Candidatus Eisenbacteria bacterium]MBU2690177.1 PEP/pyruvate-binding domain-containing protein [Candidatus Eisenbacteria bacterium]
MSEPDNLDIPQFDRRFLHPDAGFTQIGSGDLGGKASGLNLVRTKILSKIKSEEFPQIEVKVPTLAVLTTELFDIFMEQNDLYSLVKNDMPDDRIAHAFQKGSFPARFIGDLRALISEVHTPLAVRSSSRLEDALDHPFAGVYGTKMIPNNQPDIDTRFQRLVEAIKFVYASTFFRQAQNYLSSVGQERCSEKMAVIVQKIVGRRYADRFYPGISGVGRSYNYYPSGQSSPSDGVVNLALGLGKEIVDGGLSWTYSPASPQAPSPFNDIGDLLKNTQTRFWVVNMGRPPLPDPVRETEYLNHIDLSAAEMDNTLRFIASTFDGSSGRMRPGVGFSGPRVLDFAPILQYDSLPLNQLIKRLLEISEEALGAEVEIEFALNYDLNDGLPVQFGFLQVRPMVVSHQQIDIQPEECIGDSVVLATDRVLGNGLRDDILDIVFIKPDTFDAKYTREIATEIETLNRQIVNAGGIYLLIGFGRWGSSDPWLGVPIEWGQISGSRVIVEATLPNMNPDLSQGSHFFHNLIGLQILYMSVPLHSQFKINWDWLNEQPVATETKFVKHVKLLWPLEIKVDGKNGRGVVNYHEKRS